MTPIQYSRLIDYLLIEHTELFSKFPNNVFLIEGGCHVSQPARVTDQEYKELQEIITKWRDENNAV